MTRSKQLPASTCAHSSPSSYSTYLACVLLAVISLSRFAVVVLVFTVVSFEIASMFFTWSLEFDTWQDGVGSYFYLFSGLENVGNEMTWK